MSFFSSEDDGELVVVYDIGSASVGAAFVYLKKDAKPHIIYSLRRDMVFQNELNFERFRNVMEKTIHEVSENIMKYDVTKSGISKKKLKAPRIYCFMSSPWYTGQTRMVHAKKKEPFVINEKILEYFVDRELDNFKKSENIQSYIGPGDAVVLEKQVLQIKLNGYETAEPYGKNTSTLDLAVFFGVVSKEAMIRAERAMGKYFSINKLYFYTFPVASFDVLRSLEDLPDNFVFMDISGELTDVVLVKERLPIHISTFPVGKKTIIRDVVRRTGRTPEDILSALRLNQGQNNAENNAEKTTGIITTSKKAWVDSLRKILADLSDSFVVPDRVYFMSDKDVENLFLSMIVEEVSEYYSSEKVPNVVQINPKLFSLACTFSPEARRDPFIMIEALFTSKMRNN